MRANITIEDGIVKLTVTAVNQAEVQIMNRLYRRDIHTDSLHLSLNTFYRQTQQNDVSGVVFTSDHYINNKYLKHLGFELTKGRKGWTAFMSEKYKGILLYRRVGSNVIIVYNNVGGVSTDNKGDMQLSPKDWDTGVSKIGRATKLYELKQLLKPYKK